MTESVDRNEFLKSFSRLVANWTLDLNRSDVLLGEYYDICQQVGFHRFDTAVNRILYDGRYKIFPAIAEFRAYIPEAPKDEAKERRYTTLKEKFEFEKFVRDINYLAERAAKYPDDARRCRFQRSRLIGIFHFWLVQHPVCVAKLPDHLKWVTDEPAIRQYRAENPPPAVAGKWNT